MRRALTVLSVAFPFAPVGPDAVGGAEQVLSALDLELTQAGHRSIVLACEGSETTGQLVAVPSPNPLPKREGSFLPPLPLGEEGASGRIDDAARARVHQAMRAALAQILRRERVDIVHMHGIDFHAYLPPPGPPALATLHLPPAWYPAGSLPPKRPDTWVNAVSSAQDRALRALTDSQTVLPSIPNGVPVDRLAASRHAQRGFALMLGRICPEKGQHLGMDAARLAGVSLLLAGAVFPYPAHQAYFRGEVVARLDRNRRFLGPIGFARKRRLLHAARCLLVPSLASETSSLVAMEALACGTPVIAFRVGALPEIVEHGVTGFLVRDVAEMASAIRQAPAIDPEHCRRTARTRFSLNLMSEAYLRLYGHLTAAHVDR